MIIIFVCFKNVFKIIDKKQTIVLVYKVIKKIKNSNVYQ